MLGVRPVSVVLQAFRCAATTPDTGPAAVSYCMVAPPMSLELHERGTHVVRPGTGVASVTDVRFQLRAGPAVRPEPATINPS
jgi:hypothetical protein